MTAPRWLGTIDDPDDTATKILVAAAELFEQQSPTQVSLRAIATRAGVNYGLVHHYFKSKDAILAALLRRASEYGASRMTGSETIDQALDQLVDVDSKGGYARMLAWAMLDETDPAKLVSASPAQAHITAIVKRRLDGDDTDTDPRIVTAVVISAILGWRLFRPFITVAAELTDRDAGDVDAEVVTAIRAAIRDMIDGRSDDPLRSEGR